MNIAINSIAYRIILCLAITFSLSPEPVNASQTIKLASTEWEPYTGTSLPDHGYFSEIVSKAFERMGYQVEFEYYPWARALQTTQRGNIDGLMTADFTAERSELLDFTIPVQTIREVFISLHDSPVTFNGNLDSLKGYTIGIMRGSAQADKLLAADIDVELVATQHQNVKKLVLRRVDAILLPEEVFFTILKQIDPDYSKSKFTVQAPAFTTYDMHVAFSKNRAWHKQFTQDFNQGLQLIIEDGTYHVIQQKHLQHTTNTAYYPTAERNTPHN